MEIQDRCRWKQPDRGKEGSMPVTLGAVGLWVSSRLLADDIGGIAAELEELDEASPPVPKERGVLAALGRRMLPLAADRTAGAHPYLVTAEHTRRARAILGPEPLLAPEQMVVLETEPQRAREIGRAVLARYLQLPNYTNNLRRLGYTEEDFADGGSDALVDALVAWGTPEDI